MRPPPPVTLAVGLILAAAMLGIVVHHQARNRTSVGTFGPSAQALRLDDALFRPEPVPSGIISRDQALRAAGGLRHPTGARAVRYSLIFGDFTTPYYLNPSASRTIRSRAVWIFTLTGVWVQEALVMRTVRSAAHHEGDLVIDARTGRYLLGFGL